MDMAAKHERRALAAEIRTQGRRLVGYAATFNTPTLIGDEFAEIIAPGAFSASLASGRDTLALVDHDTSRVLARTKSGSLRLAEDKQGLHFDLDLPDTTTGRDVLALAERGDLGGMSFGFTAIDQSRENGRRELRNVRLHEISVVMAWPAYAGTIVEPRSLQILTPMQSYADRSIKILELIS